MKKSAKGFSIEPVFSKYIQDASSLEDYFVNITLAPGESAKFKRLNKEGFYVVSSGLLKLEVLKPQPRLLRLCTPGEMAGYGWWHNASSPIYQLTAIEDSEIQFWARHSFETLRASSIELNDLVIEHLTLTVHYKDERIALLETSSAEARIAALLLWLASRFGSKEDGGILINVNLNRESLAQLAGTSVITFTRTVGELVEKNIVKRKRWKIQVQNLSELRKLSEQK